MLGVIEDPNVICNGLDGLHTAAYHVAMIPVFSEGKLNTHNHPLESSSGRLIFLLDGSPLCAVCFCAVKTLCVDVIVRHL